MINRTVGGGEWCGQIVVTLHHQNLHIRILDHRRTQAAYGAGKSALGVFPLPLLKDWLVIGKHAVGRVNPVIEFGTQIIVEGRGVGRKDRGLRRIVVAIFVWVWATETAIESPNEILLVKQQLVDESRNVNTQVVRFDHLDATLYNATVARQFSGVPREPGNRPCLERLRNHSLTSGQLLRESSPCPE